MHSPPLLSFRAQRSGVEKSPTAMLPPLHWPHSIERNADSFLRKKLGETLRIGPRNFFHPEGLKIEPSAILVSEG